MTVHDPKVQHRSSGWARWRGWCETCRQGTDWCNQAEAGEWVSDHAEDFPPPTECACWNADLLEYEPRDCPIPDHKKKAQQ